MDKGEILSAKTLDQAKTWIGSAFQRVGSSFRERKSSSYESSRAEPAELVTHERNSEPELSISGIKLLNLDKLKETCARTFGAKNFYKIPNLDDSYQSKDSEHKSDFENLVKGSQGEQVLDPIGQRMSFTTLESESVGREIKQFSLEKMRNLQFSRPALQWQESLMSGDSGVSLDYQDSVNKESRYSTVFENSSSQTRTDEFRALYERNVQVETGKFETSKMKEIEEKAHEKVSKNYSIFCENLNNFQDKTGAISKTNDLERYWPYSCGFRNSFQMNKTNTQETFDNKEVALKGRLKLSLQHFQNSRQLRVIVLCAETGLEDRTVFCKLALIGNKSTQKGKTHKTRNKTGSAEFKESFYMETKSDDLIGYVLRVELCKVSRILKRPIIFGKAFIDLEDVDISLDTTMWVTLRDEESVKQVLFEYFFS